jgi:hypothetical protein
LRISLNGSLGANSHPWTRWSVTDHKTRSTMQILEEILFVLNSCILTFNHQVDARANVEQGNAVLSISR